MKTNSAFPLTYWETFDEFAAALNAQLPEVFTRVRVNTVQSWWRRGGFPAVYDLPVAKAVIARGDTKFLEEKSVIVAIAEARFSNAVESLTDKDEDNG